MPDGIPKIGEQSRLTASEHDVVPSAQRGGRLTVCRSAWLLSELTTRHMRKRSPAPWGSSRYDPNRLARIKRDLGAVLVWPFTAAGAVAEFHGDVGICALYSVAGKDVSAPLVALSIVHEATHARLACIPVTSDSLPRMERVCLEQELTFARNIPEKRAALAAYVENRVASFDPTAYTQRARIQRGLQVLDEEGAPRALLAVMRFFARLTTGA